MPRPEALARPEDMSREELAAALELDRHRRRKYERIAASWKAKYDEACERCKKLEQLTLPFPP